MSSDSESSRPPTPPWLLNDETSDSDEPSDEVEITGKVDEKRFIELVIQAEKPFESFHTNFGKITSKNLDEMQEFVRNATIEEKSQVANTLSNVLNTEDDPLACSAAYQGKCELLQLLIDVKVDIEQHGTYEPHRTPLDYAAINGHLSAVKTLVNAGASLHLKQEPTPLTLSALANHVDVVKYLMSLVPNWLWNIDANHIAPIHWRSIHAYKFSHNAMLHLFIQNSCSTTGMSILLYSVAEKEPEWCRRLLTLGADMHEKDVYGTTPYMVAKSMPGLVGDRMRQVLDIKMDI